MDSKTICVFNPYHHRRKPNNKWLTVVFLSVLLAPGVVECGGGKSGVSSGVEAQSLTAIENETVVKVRDKGQGSSSNAAGGGFGGVFGNVNSRTGKAGGGGGNSITSNELNHPYAFNAVDDEDASYDEEDDSSYTYDSFEDVKNTEDSEFIKEHDKPDEHDHDQQQQEKPMIGKCCRLGEGLTLRGGCDKIHEHNLFNNDQFWFPEKVYDVAAEKMVINNISDWDVHMSNKIQCRAGERAEIIYDMRRFTVLKDGSLYVYAHQKIVRPLDYCIDQELGKGQGRVVKACFTKEELCDDKQCLRKCCPKGSISEIIEGPTRFRCERSSLVEKYHFNDSNIVASNPTCSDGIRLEPIETYNISDNGTLQTPSFSAPLLSYCLDYFIDKAKGNTDERSLVPILKAMICFDTKYDELDSKGLIVLPHGVAVVFGITMIISAICLAVAAVISWRLPELRSLHGKCQLSHLVTMFFLYLCLGIVQVGTQHIPQGLCTFFGVFIHICALSSFLWLNLLCVNIYLTFRSLRPPLAAGRRDENRRLLFLCIYAWGIPAAFCLFLYTLDSSPSRLDPMPLPEYGHLKCLISNRGAEFAYLFGPVGVLLLCNGLLFCLTAQELLCGVWRLDNSDSINFRRKSMGIVVAKLGIVMGLGWILDVISWAIGTNSPYMFYAADLFNSFQGVLISVILLWRKRVLEVLHLRKPSITKDETLTARPFLSPKNGSVNAMSNGDHDTSLVIGHDQDQ